MQTLWALVCCRWLLLSQRNATQSMLLDSLLIRPEASVNISRTSTYHQLSMLLLSDMMQSLCPTETRPETFGTSSLELNTGGTNKQQMWATRRAVHWCRPYRCYQIEMPPTYPGLLARLNVLLTHIVYVDIWVMDLTTDKKEYTHPFTYIIMWHMLHCLH